MVYITLLAILALFTILDALITATGISIGCVELNPIILIWSVQPWMLFRMLLVGFMLITFSKGHEICLKHFPKGSKILEKILIALDLYIISVVVLGFLAICLKLL